MMFVFHSSNVVQILLIFLLSRHHLHVSKVAHQSQSASRVELVVVEVMFKVSIQMVFLDVVWKLVHAVGPVMVKDQSPAVHFSTNQQRLLTTETGKSIHQTG